MHLLSRFALFTPALFLFGCSPTPELHKIEGSAQGTTYHFSFELPAGSTAELSTIEKEVNAEFARLDLALSNYRDDSHIEQINAQKTTDVIAADAELIMLIEEARKVYIASHGCYDLTVKPLFDLWGFKNDKFSPPTDESLAQTLATIGMDKLETINATHLRKQIPELRIDISSIGQGYSVGQLAKVLEKFGVKNYMVEIGGELKIQGKKNQTQAWRIALEKPLPNERKLHKIVSFDSGEPVALMASGTYRHFFDSAGKRYSHILDARTGKPVEHNTVSVTVLHPDPTVADAWSTALICLGSSDGIKVANDNHIAALFIDQKLNDQRGDQLSEMQSDAMNEMKGVSFTQK
jgi:thiamine biosynthesis lipoprotein